MTEKEELYHQLFEAESDAVFLIDNESGRILEANAAASTLYGYSREELLSKKNTDLSAEPEDTHRVTRTTPLAEDRVIVIPLRFHHKKDGTVFPVEITGRFFLWRGRPTHLAAIRDITERKRAEDALKESEEKFRILVEKSPLGLAMIDADGRYKYLSPRFVEMFGYTLEDIPTGRDWFRKAFSDADERRRIISTWEKDRQDYGVGETRLRTFEVTCKDGSRKLISIRSVTLEAGSQMVIYEDMTEKRKLEEQLRQAQKMEAVGTLAGGIAHDFNNILAVILGYAELSVDDVGKGTLLHGNLQEILRAGHRGKELVKQILTFGRRSERTLQPVHLSSLITETMKMLRSTIPSSIDIRQRICPESLTVEADPSQIHQVIVNLCVNAADAVSEAGGIVEVGVDPIDFDQSIPLRYPDLSPGRYARLTVSDNGHGIPKGILDRIFEPYFTTKEIHKGTGLGLAVVHSIVKSHRGHITVYSEPGKGTTFHVYLPLAESSADMTPRTPDEPPGGGERILFVDDEPSIVSMQKVILERLGYKVTATTSSLEALEAFRAAPDQYDLVITDMTMPKMTGEKLAGEVKRIRPGIPVILCTGFSERVNGHQAMEMTIDEFLMKPVDRDKLAKTIRKVMEGKSSRVS